LNAGKSATLPPKSFLTPQMLTKAQHGCSTLLGNKLEGCFRSILGAGRRLKPL
jgi:hypothetical protein